MLRLCRLCTSRKVLCSERNISGNLIRLPDTFGSEHKWHSGKKLCAHHELGDLGFGNKAPFPGDLLDLPDVPVSKYISGEEISGRNISGRLCRSWKGWSV